jgi:hypothetical protein
MLITIPSLVEEQVTNYLKAHNLPYSVYMAFGLDNYTQPCILVKAGKFSQLSPNTGVFDGKFIVSIVTQIDEVSDTLATHDEMVGQIYDLMESADLISSFDTEGKAWQIQLETVDQDKQDRALITLLEYACYCQNQK